MQHVPAQAQPAQEQPADGAPGKQDGAERADGQPTEGNGQATEGADAGAEAHVVIPSRPWHLADLNKERRRRGRLPN